MVGKPPSRYILTHTLAPIGDSQVRMLGYTCPPFIFVPPCLTMYFFVALASHVELKEAGANCTSSNVTFHKSIQGDHWGPNDTFDKSVRGDHRGPLLARARHGISKNKESTVASPVYEDSPPPRRILLPDMSVLQIQALLDFVVVIILGGLVGILFRK